MTHPHDNPARDALRALDQQRADTLADALRPVAAPTGDDAEALRLREERNEISAECVKLRARLAAASHRADDADARATAAEARVAELLSDRAEAAEVLVAEVERAQTAERRAAELTAHVEDLRDTVCNLLAEIGDPAHLCNAVPGCGDHATWECADDGYSTGACDTHREGRAGEWHPAPHAATLRSLDGVSR